MALQVFSGPFVCGFWVERRRLEKTGIEHRTRGSSAVDCRGDLRRPNAH